MDLELFPPVRVICFYAYGRELDASAELAIGSVEGSAGNADKGFQPASMDTVAPNLAPSHTNNHKSPIYFPFTGDSCFTGHEFTFDLQNTLTPYPQPDLSAEGDYHNTPIACNATITQQSHQPSLNGLFGSAFSTSSLYRCENTSAPLAIADPPAIVGPNKSALRRKRDFEPHERKVRYVF